jgi:acyl homoserine lactone synthase
VIIVVEGHNADAHAELLDKMFRLRARVFHDQLQWNVCVVDGKERDKYDDQHPTYIIYTDENCREVRGSLRLLPTTGPTLLTDCFADTVPATVDLRAPTIWECTRFCLDSGILARRRESVLFASTVMLIALGDVAVNAGIESIIGNFNQSMLRLYRRIGCDVEILGSTSSYGEAVYLGVHPISEAVVRGIRSRLKVPRSAFFEARLAPRSDERVHTNADMRQVRPRPAMAVR